MVPLEEKGMPRWFLAIQVDLSSGPCEVYAVTSACPVSFRISASEDGSAHFPTRISRLQVNSILYAKETTLNYQDRFSFTYCPPPRRLRHFPSFSRTLDYYWVLKRGLPASPVLLYTPQLFDAVFL